MFLLSFGKNLTRGGEIARGCRLPSAPLPSPFNSRGWQSTALPPPPQLGVPEKSTVADTEINNNEANDAILQGSCRVAERFSRTTDELLVCLPVPDGNLEFGGANCYFRSEQMYDSDEA